MEDQWSEYFYNKLYNKYGGMVHIDCIENNKNITLNFVKKKNPKNKLGLR